MSTFTEVEELLDNTTRRIERRIGEAKALAEQGRRAKQQAEQAKATMVACEEATAFLNSFADARQAKVQLRIEQLVTHGLTTIFGEDLTFHVLSEQKANRTEVSFVLRSTMDGQMVETPILDARGGGVAAVIGFLLRLIITLLRKEHPVLVVDEGFAQVSENYLPALAEFLKELSVKTGVQIIMVTHSPLFEEYADKVYRFTQKDGKTIVSEADTEIEGGG
jgi:DNA repair exonuclease SbcCD ATPase subunit